MYQTAYQTEIFGITPAKSTSAPRRPHVGPCRGLFARDCRMDGLAGKARDRANEGPTLGGKGDTLSKCRTVRKIDGVYKEQYTESLRTSLISSSFFANQSICHGHNAELRKCYNPLFTPARISEESRNPKKQNGLDTEKTISSSIVIATNHHSWFCNSTK